MSSFCRPLRTSSTGLQKASLPDSNLTAIFQENNVPQKFISKTCKMYYHRSHHQNSQLKEPQKHCKISLFSFSCPVFKFLHKGIQSINEVNDCCSFSLQFEIYTFQLVENVNKIGQSGYKRIIFKVRSQFVLFSHDLKFL